MAGLLTPYAAQELVGALKESTELPIDLHTHYTSGVASMTYLKAVENGCDIIDTAMSPLALGTSQPATEAVSYTHLDVYKRQAVYPAGGTNLEGILQCRTAGFLWGSDISASGGNSRFVRA